MKMHPMLFSGPMVRALLDGRKSQTRRVLTRRNSSFDGGKWPNWVNNSAFNWLEAFVDASFGAMLKLPWIAEQTLHRIRPRYEVGDLIWVRESGWQRPERTPREMRDGADTWPPFDYDADGSDAERLKAWGWKRRPSIHMPRAASRITLEITAMRIERLDAINETDAQAEGFGCITKDGGQTFKYGIPDLDGYPGKDDHGWPWEFWHVDPRVAYRRLWDAINGAGAWAANPWVWVIEFKVHAKNIDALARERGASA